MGFSIAGIGSFLPPHVADNAEVASLVGISAPRIRDLFDIDERRWAGRRRAGESGTDLSVADLAVRAASRALEDAGLTPSDVDVLIAVSTTPEYISPPLDYRVRHALGASDMLGFTLHSACTGVFRAATLVEALLSTRRARVALVVAADAISKYFVFDRDLPKDLRMSMALYGDGAGAFVAVEGEDRLPSVDGVTMVTTSAVEPPGIFFSGPYAGHGADPEGDERTIAYHDFRRVLEKGGQLTRTAADAVLAGIGKGFEDVDHIVTHQATGKLKMIAESLGLPAEKLHVNIEKVGNTLSPSTLILLDELKRKEVLRRDELVLMCSAESATWSYGGMAIRWS